MLYFITWLLDRGGAPPRRGLVKPPPQEGRKQTRLMTLESSSQSQTRPSPRVRPLVARALVCRLANEATLFVKFFHFVSFLITYKLTQTTDICAPTPQRSLGAGYPNQAQCKPRFQNRKTLRWCSSSRPFDILSLYQKLITDIRHLSNTFRGVF